MDLDKKQLIVCKATKPILVKTANSREFILKDEIFFIYDKIDGGFDVSVFRCKNKKGGTIYLETLYELAGIDSQEQERIIFFYTSRSNAINNFIGQILKVGD